MVLKNWVVLDETGPARFLIKKYRETLGSFAGDHLDLQFYQHSVVLWIDIYVAEIHTGIASGHSLQFLHDGCFYLWSLILKDVTPDRGSVPRSAGQFSLLDVESIGKITLDQFKIGERELEKLILCVETNECGHKVFTLCQSCQSGPQGDQFSLEICGVQASLLSQPDAGFYRGYFSA